MEENQSGNLFERKIKPVLLYIGMIGAIFMGLAYIILMFIMILGFNGAANLSTTITFAIINAIVGFIIMQFLKIQGIDFAKNLPNNIEILKQYNKTKPKQKKHHSLKAFWIRTVIKDIITKVVTVAAATIGVIYIIIEGSKDYTMLLLAGVNLIMFACFGLLSLVSAYDFFNDDYIPYIIERGQEYERKNQEALEMASKESTQQANDNLHTDRGVNLLESSNSCGDPCTNSEPVVLDINE